MGRPIISDIMKALTAPRIVNNFVRSFLWSFYQFLCSCVSSYIKHVSYNNFIIVLKNKIKCHHAIKINILFKVILFLFSQLQRTMIKTRLFTLIEYWNMCNFFLFFRCIGHPSIFLLGLLECSSPSSKREQKWHSVMVQVYHWVSMRSLVISPLSYICLNV